MESGVCTRGLACLVCVMDVCDFGGCGKLAGLVFVMMMRRRVDCSATDIVDVMLDIWWYCQ